MLARLTTKRKHGSALVLGKHSRATVCASAKQAPAASVARPESADDLVFGLGVVSTGVSRTGALATPGSVSERTSWTLCEICPRPAATAAVDAARFTCGAVRVSTSMLRVSFLRHDHDVFPVVRQQLPLALHVHCRDPTAVPYLSLSWRGNIWAARGLERYLGWPLEVGPTRDVVRHGVQSGLGPPTPGHRPSARPLLAW